MSSTTNIVSSQKNILFEKFGSKAYLLIFLLFILFMVIIYYINKRFKSDYHKVFDKIKSHFHGHDDIDIEKVGVSFEYEPVNSESEEYEEIEEENGGNSYDKCKKRGSIDSHKQVFNISDNIYSYYDAMALCKAYDSKLANYKQVTDAYKNGAEWCNYGWTKGQMALYPTQKCTWEKLQRGPKSHRYDCGRPGINGGYFDNPYLKFGVNCYGNKPKPTSKEKQLIKLSTNPYLTQKEREFKNKVDYYKSRKYDYTILPFHKKKWSGQ